MICFIYTLMWSVVDKKETDVAYQFLPIWDTGNLKILFNNVSL